AGNVAGHGAGKEHGADKEKEKMEKRRALGRGLASLLPGPRMVAPAPPASVANVGSGGAAGTRAGVPAPHGPAPQNPAELRSAGQPGAAVPTSSLSTASAPTPASISAPPSFSSQPPAASDSLSANVTTTADDHIVRDASGEPITIRAQAVMHYPGNLVVNLDIADIDKNPFQTRYVNDDDALEELADSIKVNGVVQPIMVRPSEEDETRYVLILGERRLHASKKAGKTQIPAIVRRVPAQQAAEMTIVENLQREDLSPLEQAEAFRVLSTEFSLTQQQIAERVGLSRASVANYMRLLKLPIAVMELLAQKSINFAQAKELLKLEDNDRIAEAAIYAVKKGMTVEQIESLVLRMDGLLDPIPGMPGVKKRESSGGARWVDPNVRAAQTDLERMLGVRVRIRDRKGKGKIVIEYSTVDDYERVVEMLRGKK
ncbi:MAG TPA: ParB/RepB/Spo0J family partition protein, partial [Candidatus Binatia bacterium]|nr:ParB/RepB/Spo0J family partition protein [Candidatus Binatia bacterium]